MSATNKTLLLIGVFCLFVCAPASALVQLPIDHDWTVTVLGWKFGIESYPAYRDHPASSTVYYGIADFSVWQSPYIVVTEMLAMPLLLIAGFVALRHRQKRRHDEA